MPTLRQFILKVYRWVLLFLILIFQSTPVAHGHSLLFKQWKTIISLSHSLMIRVANLRASRGDYIGSDRARQIAEKLESALGFRGGFWSLSWDYLKNYAWRDVISHRTPEEFFQAVSDMNKLMRSLNELSRLGSDSERAQWVRRNYQNVVSVSRSLLKKLLLVFSHSGPIRDMMLILQREAQGDLVRDCLELGAYDLKGLLQIAKDIFVNIPSTSFSSERVNDSDL